MRLKSFIGAVLVVVLILGLSFPGYSWYVGNYSGKGFDESGGGTDNPVQTVESTSLTIEDLIIKSATNFLRGKAHVDWLAANLEAADHEGLYFYDLQSTVNDALYYMKIARNYYKTLNEQAANVPYNMAVISQLQYFDYESFSKKYKVNSASFDQVRSYLEAGDVRGAYTRFLSYTENIIDELEVIQRDLYCWRMPPEENVWALNQECAQMLLFGQYIAQIFYQVH